MNGVQSILTIGGMILLALISMRFNSSVLQSTSSDLDNKVYLTSFSIADNMLEKIRSKSFDQTTVSLTTTNPASLTLADSLGPDNGEVYPNFNDIDDFNGFQDSTTAPYFELYYIYCTVQYVDSNNPDLVVNYQTFYKKATITVSSPYLKHPISESEIFTLK